MGKVGTVPTGSWLNNRKLVASLLFGLLAYTSLFPFFDFDSPEQQCPQETPFEPTKNLHLDQRYNQYFNSDAYRAGMLQRFSGAIQIPTVAYDSMRGNGPNQVDPELHKPFLDFHKYLKNVYPLVHEKLETIVINDYSLLFVWKGNNSSLKPMMLMAHQDVVPIDPATVNDWFHQPFSGYVDDERIWGRGTSDTKMTLISIMESIEALLQVDYSPARTIFVAFGHDEEISGYNGAKHIVEYIQSTLGISQNGIEFILDEGMTLALVNSDTRLQASIEPKIPFAYVGVSEKGYMDVNVTVTLKQGGHASVAPKHTAIGILAKIITRLEENPYTPDLQGTNPILGQMICMAEHTNALSETVKYALKHWQLFKPLLLNEFSKDTMQRISVVTTQAVDVIHGGVKVNALPTFVYALVNMRIAPHENVKAVSDRFLKTIAPIAYENQLDLVSMVSTHNASDTLGRIHVTFDGLEPSPVSSTNTFAFARLSAVIRRVFGADVIVSPTLMTANTDTKWVWNLTESIFRFMPFFVDGTEQIHTVNENAKIESVVGTVKFYHELIRAFDE